MGCRGLGGAALTLMPSQEKSVRVCCEERGEGVGTRGTSSEGLPEEWEVERAFLRLTQGIGISAWSICLVFEERRRNVL